MVSKQWRLSTIWERVGCDYICSSPTVSTKSTWIRPSTVIWHATLHCWKPLNEQVNYGGNTPRTLLLRHGNTLHVCVAIHSHTHTRNPCKNVGTFLFLFFFQAVFLDCRLWTSGQMDIESSTLARTGNWWPEDASLSRKTIQSTISSLFEKRELSSRLV